jgi:hypothetical protein
MPNGYTLFTYYSEAAKAQVVSAIHWRDVSLFLKEYPDAVRKAI